LDRKRVTYNEYLLDDDDFQREVMIRRSNGRTSVPQIFIGGRGIGGCDELHVLDSVGELDVMLGLVD
jgi:glutaredoxin 3